jgi:hypothetical protein
LMWFLICNQKARTNHDQGPGPESKTFTHNSFNVSTCSNVTYRRVKHSCASRKAA